MAAGDVTTTYTHTRGRLVRHTLIKCVVECNATTAVSANLDSTEIPTAYYAGMVQGRVDDRAGANNIQINIKSGATTAGNDNANQIYVLGVYAVDADPKYIPMKSFFAEVPTPTNANHLGGIVFPTPELNIWTHSSSAAENDGQTITLWIALLSHILEV